MIRGFLHALLLVWFFMCGNIVRLDEVGTVMVCILIGICGEMLILADWGEFEI